MVAANTQVVVDIYDTWNTINAGYLTTLNANFQREIANLLTPK